MVLTEPWGRRLGVHGLRRPSLRDSVWRVAFGIIFFGIVFLWVILVDAGVDGQGRVELVPGFAIFFQAHDSRVAVGIEAEHGLGSADFDGDDVPDVERDDVAAMKSISRLV